jgi:hypothetical protein
MLEHDNEGWIVEKRRRKHSLSHPTLPVPEVAPPRRMIEKKVRQSRLGANEPINKASSSIFIQGRGSQALQQESLSPLKNIFQKHFFR